MSAVTRIIKRRELPGVLPDLPNNTHPVLQRLYACRGVKNAGELERGHGGHAIHLCVPGSGQSAQRGDAAME